MKWSYPYPVISELPSKIKEMSFAELSIKPCLVLRDHPDYALPPVSDALKAKLNPIVKCFALMPPVVVNSSMAIKWQLNMAWLKVWSEGGSDSGLPLAKSAE